MNYLYSITYLAQTNYNDGAYGEGVYNGDPVTSTSPIAQVATGNLWWLVWAALALIVLGAIIWIVAKKRRGNQQPPSAPPNGPTTYLPGQS